jgi:hypothetical protein
MLLEWTMLEEEVYKDVSGGGEVYHRVSRA